MESRIPKPNTLTKQLLPLTNMNVGKNCQNTMKTQTNLPHPVTSTKFTNETKRIENVSNNGRKCNDENKPPSQILTQKSTAIISKSKNGIKGIKRPATALTDTDETKKSKVTVNVNSINRRRSVKNTLRAKTLVNRPTINNTNKKTTTTATTVNKWDYKGRFNLVNSELIELRATYKEVLAKNAELQNSVELLKSNENEYKIKIEEYATLQTALTKEVDTIKDELKKAQEEKEDFKERWKRSEEACGSVTEELKEYQNKYEEQRTKLQEQAVELKEIKGKFEYQEKLIRDLTYHKEELQALAHQMDKNRRVLHNTIQEMKGNIRVFCRVRPRTPKEALKQQCFIKYMDECTIEIGKSDGSDVTCYPGKTRAIRQEFSFDKVFPHTASQADIFEELSLLVQSALEGYNVCVFAYGQTGSGKTYTMEGEPGPDTEGMIPRTVRHIFKEMREFELLGWVYRIEASFLEIYNEHIVDLLDSGYNKIHEIRMRDNKGHDLYVSNLKVEEIHNAEELHECLLIAQRNRAVAATNSNERSSRSHSVARIRLIGEHKTKKEICVGNLNLVDLAGSERLKGEEAARTAETKNINKSLANLGNVILALLKKQEHVPYRNSKLTHLLMPSLGGNSKTLMLLNISPLDECYSETLNSLRFASNVNNCKISARRVKSALSSTSNIDLTSSSTGEIMKS